MICARSVMPLERYCQTIQEDAIAAQKMKETAESLVRSTSRQDGCSELRSGSFDGCDAQEQGNSKSPCENN